MLLSIPVSKPVLGVVLSLIIYAVTFFLPAFMLNPVRNTSLDFERTAVGRLFATLLPNFSLDMGLQLIQQRNVFGGYSSFGNLFEPIGVFGYYSLGFVMCMQILSSILMSFLIWYLDAVWPWQDGVPQPFYFIFTPKYWCGTKGNNEQDTSYEQKQDVRYFERQVSTAETAISIRDLRKEFGNKVAVDGVSLDVKHGQITCLLGHNGAGKTTTMNMITGIFPSTSGSITVNGYDVATQTRQARLSISLCPQHNVLYDELTVMEHLILYAAIKGSSYATLEEEAAIAAEKAQLGDAKLKKPPQLSGGMKRKLCMGIALVGGTKVVILDEPTSGMDPEARRGIWDLLRSVRRERTILLTTHYMEEADALGDSIAIMAAGKVSCSGTPIFLKKAFSTGYNLRIAKAPNFDREQVSTLISNHFPKGQLTSEIDTEVIFSLESSDGQTDTAMLPRFFRDLEEHKAKLGIAASGLSLTTLEDVFLRVGEMAEAEETGNNNHDKNRSSDFNQLEMENEARPLRVHGFSLNLLRFKGLLLKRVNFAKRYWPMIIFQILVPSILFMGALLLSNSMMSGGGQPPLWLNLRSMYGATKSWFQENPDDTGPKKFYTDASSKFEGTSMSYLGAEDDPNNYLIGITNWTSTNDYSKKYLIGGSVKSTYDNKREYQVWYNGEAIHSMPTAINTMYEGLLSELTGAVESIDVTNHPLPSADKFSNRPDSGLLTMMWMFMVPLTVPFLAASFVMFPVHERASKSKLLQMMTGLHPTLFWAASFLFDMASHILSISLIMIIFAIFDTRGIIMGSPGGASALFAMLFMCGLAAIPFAYMISHGVEKPATGFSWMVVAYIATGLVFTISVTVNENAGASSKQYPGAQGPPAWLLPTMLWTFRSQPIFSLTWGFKKVFNNGLMPAFCRAQDKEMLKQLCVIPDGTTFPPSFFVCCPKNVCGDKCVEEVNPWNWGDKGIGEELTMTTIMIFVYLFILILLEMGWGRMFAPLIRRFKRGGNAEDQAAMISAAPSYGNDLDALGQPMAKDGDTDVVAERFRVDNIIASAALEEDALLVKELHKKYGNFSAVNGLTFGVHHKECFGLLGVNGAGKTTTFKMITGDLTPTSGTAQAGALNIWTSLSEFQQHLGYCPQFDALLDKMTGREMLYLFGRLRGIPEYYLARSSNELIEMADLHKYADRPTETYSGGNKRKLSLAIALMGSPALLLLDEPTSGVDPGARRKIWTTLAKVRQEMGCSIILTSHSMEECEALCSRVAIMVNGQFRCIGPVQHLRSRYGEGYTVIIKLKRELLDEGRHSLAVQEFIKQQIRSAYLRDAHETVINYHITDTSLTWADLFEQMEYIKAQFDLEDYSVSDTTLEQIFIAFARHQAAENKRS